MRSLRAAPLTTQARWELWWARSEPRALVRRWTGRWRRFWAGIATMGEGLAPMPLVPGVTCPWCRLRALVQHCDSPTCPWIHCPGCRKNARPDLFEKEDG